MSKKTAKHRVKMVIEFSFGYCDEIGFTEKNRLATKAEIISELTKELKNEGLHQFVQTACHSPKTKLKSLSFIKFDK
jgi:hypothetical protein